VSKRRLVVWTIATLFLSFLFNVSSDMSIASSRTIAVNYEGSTSIGGKVGYWDFSRANNLGYNFSDGSSLTISSTTTTSQVSLPNGESTNAITLNGSTYLSGPIRNLPTQNSSYSVGAWIKTSTTTAGAYGILGWGNYGTSKQVNALRTGTSCSGYGSIVNYSWGSDSEKCGNAVTPNINIYDKNWHFVMSTYNGSTRTIYCDGKSLGSDSISSLAVVSTDMTIGATYNHTEYFEGQLAEVSIFSKALSSTEVSNLYSSSQGSLTSDSNGNFTLPSPPTQSEMTFVGWYSDQAFSHFVGNSGDTVSLDSSVTSIYADYLTVCSASKHLSNGSFETIPATTWSSYDDNHKVPQIGDFNTSQDAVATSMCWQSSESDHLLELQRQVKPSGDTSNTGTATYPFTSVTGAGTIASPYTPDTGTINRIDTHVFTATNLYDASAAIPVSGNYYAEINANTPGMLYQDISTVPGITLKWTLSHKGRNSPTTTDDMHVEIGNAVNLTLNYYSQKISDSQDSVGNTPSNFSTDPRSARPSGFTESWVAEDSGVISNATTTLVGKASQMQSAGSIFVSTPNPDVWGVYSGTYTVPAGQTLTRFGFVSDNQGSVGNLLDNITFTQSQGISWSPSSLPTNLSNTSYVANATDDFGTPITYYVSSTGTANCTISNGQLSWTATGSCVVTAHTDGSTDYSGADVNYTFNTTYSRTGSLSWSISNISTDLYSTATSLTLQQNYGSGITVSSYGTPYLLEASLDGSGSCINWSPTLFSIGVSGPSWTLTIATQAHATSSVQLGRGNCYQWTADTSTVSTAVAPVATDSAGANVVFSGSSLTSNILKLPSAIATRWPDVINVDPQPFTYYSLPKISRLAQSGSVNTLSSVNNIKFCAIIDGSTVKTLSTTSSNAESGISALTIQVGTLPKTLTVVTLPAYSGVTSNCISGAVNEINPLPEESKTITVQPYGITRLIMHAPIIQTRH